MLRDSHSRSANRHESDYSILREDRRGMKESAVMLSAVEAVAHADAVRPSRRDDPDATAQEPTVKRLGPSRLIPLCDGGEAPARRT
jgi:hypothetical protein